MLRSHQNRNETLATALRCALALPLCAVLASCGFSSADTVRKYDSVTHSTIGISDNADEQQRLHDLERRNTDEQLEADMETIKALQARIAKLNDQGRPMRDYFMAKAQAWLDFGRDEYTENDRSGVANAALRESLLIIKILESGELPGFDTPLIETTVLLREDLWRLAAEMKAIALQGIYDDCADATIAEFEVALVWSGHEQPELGWRHAEPYIRYAEDLARQAGIELNNCQAPKLAPLPAACPVMCPTAAVAAQQPVVRVPNNIHFALDKSTISSVSAMILNRLADLMLERPDMEVLLTGHTDVYNGISYNSRLADRRAKATMKYLINRGVPAGRLSTSSAGETEVAVTGCTPTDHATNRRVSLVIYGGGDLLRTNQLDDLQITKNQTRCDNNRR